jgi:hypothetical protein
MIGREQMTPIIWQATIIAAIVFMLAIAGLTVLRGSQHRAPPSAEGQPTETQAHRNVQGESSPSDDKTATDIAAAGNDKQPSDEVNCGADNSKSQQKEIDDSIAKYTLWLMLFTGVLAVATVFLAVATAGLWNYAAEQANDMKKTIATAVRGANAARDAVTHSDQANELQLRAYVFLRLVLDDNVITDNTYGVTYVIPNDGKTPAIDIKLFRKVDVLPYPLPKGYVLPVGELSGGITLPPGAQPTGIIRTDTTLSGEDVRKITSQNSGFRLYFWGETAYTDVFGQKRWTKFCMSRPPEGATVRGVTWEMTPDYNSFY